MTADSLPPDTERAGFDAVVATAQVVICCGPGGVGKTTVAAALGRAAARRGRRVVVVTIDPARRLGDALGLPGGLGGEPQRIALTDDDGATDAAGEFSAMMLDTEATFVEIVRSEAADDEQAERILANRFFVNLVTTLGGTQEYMAAETLHRLAGDDRFDLVVIDTPPTRNALEFLAAPGVLTRFLDHKLFRLLMMPTRRGMRLVNTLSQPLLRTIGRVVGAEVLADAVAFFQAFAGMEAGFRQRAASASELLRADGTTYVVVASPRPEAVAEASWFAGELVDQGITQIGGVVNLVHPAFGDGSADDAATNATTSADPAVRARWENVADLRRRRDAELDQLAAFDTQLRRAIGDRAPWATIPLLPDDVHDQVGLIHVERALTSP